MSYRGEVVFLYAFDVAYEMTRDPVERILGQPVAPFSPNTPMSPVGAELTVTEELVQGAIGHEHVEDLSNVVPEVEVAEPLVGPPPPDEPHIVFYHGEDDVAYGDQEKEALDSDARR